MDLDPHLDTRESLLTRLKDWDDEDGWREFFHIYWKLIYSVAIKSGLTDSEAEDVVQETVLTLAKTMPTYRYEREKCRFKTWLMRITRRRIIDQFRKRGPAFPAAGGREDSSTRTDTMERLEDPSAPFLDSLWDEEWQKNLIDAAMERVKQKVKPQHYQIFYLSIIKEMKAAQVARTLGVNVAQVYLVRHRVAALVRKEVRELETKMDEQESKARKQSCA